MKRIVCNILAIAIMGAFCLWLILSNVFRISVPVITVPGSYAESYAEKNHLEQASVPDTLSVATELRYETFEYNVDGNYISLVKYKGKGEEIVIPSMIDGRLVTTIDEAFFSLSPSIHRIIISNSIREIKPEAVDLVEIVVAQDAKIKDKLSENGWKVSTYNDSEMPLFVMGDIPFEYSKNNDGINLVSYTGDENEILIPAYIDGIPVTEVSFNLVGYSFVSFPATITKISGKTYVNLYTRLFAVEFCFTVVAFFLSLLVINLRFGRFRKKEEYVLSGYRIVVSFLYLTAQICFCIWAIYKSNINWLLAGVISITALGLYVLLIFAGETGRKHAIATQEKFKQQTDRMNMIKQSVSSIVDDIRDTKVKKAVERVVEEIRFSDPVTSDELTDIEEQISKEIAELKICVTSGNEETILKQCEIVDKTVKQRNELCKSIKR